MTWLLLAFGLLAIGAFPFVKEARKPEMTDATRAKARGQFIGLSDGKTHYQWHGDPNGKVMVCVHGLTTPSYVWDQMMPGLLSAGYRVLTYDLYGRGFSDRPAGAQTRAFFIRQLRDLLDALDVKDGFTLIGYSMGGSIVSAFASAEPGRTNHLVLLAPAGMAHAPSKVTRIAAKVPLIGDWLFLMLAGPELVSGTRQTPGESLAKTLSEKQAEEIALKGYLPSVLSSIRNQLSETLEGAHKQIAKDTVDVTAIWGLEDTVIPIEAMDVLRRWNPDVAHTAIPGAGHALGMTHPDAVNAAIIKA